LDEAEEVGGDDDGHAVAPEFGDQVEELLRRLRIEARIRGGVRLCGTRNLAAAPDRLHDDGPVVVL